MFNRSKFGWVSACGGCGVSSALLYAFSADTDGVLKGLVTGTGPFTFARAGEGTLVDSEGLVKTAIDNELRFVNARRVENLHSTSDVSAWGSTSNVTVTATAEDTPDGGNGTVYRLVGNAAASWFARDLRPVVIGTEYIESFWIKRNVGTDQGFRFQCAGLTSGDFTATSTWQRIAYKRTASSTGSQGFGITRNSAQAAADVLIYGPMAEEVTGQENRNASESVSVGVESDDYHGLRADGVRQYAHMNPMLVVDDVVTDSGEKPAFTQYNRVVAPYSVSTWSTDGSPVITANDTASPLLADTLADKIELGPTQSDDLYILMTGAFSNGDSLNVLFYLKRSSTTGILNVKHPYGIPYGSWTIDFSLLSDDWELIHKGHAAVTVVAPWVAQGEGHAGFFIQPSTDIELDFWATGFYQGVAADDDWYVLFEATATNRFLYSEQFDNAAWTKSFMTISANSIAGPDGRVLADTLTATSANALAIQSVTLASSTVVWSCWLKRKTGSGVIEVSVDGGSSWTTQSVTTDWQRFTVSQAAVTNPFVSIRIVTSGDEIYAWGAQLEVDVLTSYIQTVAAQVSRVADDITPFVAVSGNVDVTKGMLILGSNSSVSAADLPATVAVVSVSDTVNSLFRLESAADELKSFDGTNTASDSLAFVADNAYRYAVRWSVDDSEFQVGYKDVTGAGSWQWGTAQTFDGAFVSGTSINAFYSGPSAPQKVRNMRIYNSDEGTDWIEANF